MLLSGCVTFAKLKKRPVCFGLENTHMSLDAMGMLPRQCSRFSMSVVFVCGRVLHRVVTDICACFSIVLCCAHSIPFHLLRLLFSHNLDSSSLTGAGHIAHLECDCEPARHNWKRWSDQRWPFEPLSSPHGPRWLYWGKTATIRMGK